MLDKLKSRKLWAFVSAAILVMVNSIAKLGMPTEDVLYLVIVSASYILGQGYVDAKQQPIKEFPIEDITQSFTHIIQAELAKSDIAKDLPMDSILDIVRTLIKQELGKLSTVQPGSSSAEPSATAAQSS
ncbi:hypothetical protein UF75_1180 [Desulfosporosinus sp. I2]|uniref:hypothetical protein n=1 Tax=Desulfosporosinus sp. I2 TaxID=1617025 RepID=UPI0005EF5C47|nr:hypothetical protein [Desulfosporosinus sp. I2]KJR48382.1 hypothetical protein UF75_1180 [Desulfosporosinus sp. I2]